MASTANIILNIGDINERVLINPDSRLKTVGYSLIGRQTSDTLINKIMTDPSNDIAATKITNGSTVTQISKTSVPSVGANMTVLSDGTIGWSTGGGSPAASYEVYVSKAGNDTTGNGSQGLPFLTVKGAYAHILDASSTKRYIINVAGGTYAETGDILVKPWTWLVGAGVDATVITSSTNNILLDPTFATGTIDFGLNNFTVGGATVINFNLFAMVGTGSVLCDAYDINCGAFTMIGRTNTDLIHMWNCACGATVLDSVNAIVKNCMFAGSSTFENASDAAGSFVWQISDSVYGSSLSILQSSTGVCSADLSCLRVITSLIITGAGFLTVTADSASLSVPTVTVTTATLVMTTQAQAVGYTPNASAKWAATAPSNITQALDRIAALVYTLNTNTPIP